MDQFCQPSWAKCLRWPQERQDSGKQAIRLPSGSCRKQGNITAILMMLHGRVSMCSSDMLSRFFNLQVFLLQANVSDQDRTRELTVLKCVLGISTLAVTMVGGGGSVFG